MEQKKIKHYRFPEDHERCTAKNKQTGERCKNFRVKGFNVCRFHGAGGGLAAKNRIKKELKTGNQKLQDKINEYANDPDILSLKKEIGIMKLIRDKCLEQIELSGINNPELVNTLNFLNTSISNLSKNMSIIDKNMTKSIDLIQLTAILMQLKTILINNMTPLNLPLEEKQKFLTGVAKDIKQVKIVDS